jgi:hypothetical protein
MPDLQAALDAAQAALAEVLSFVEDANNVTKPAVVAWHRTHAVAIYAAADKFDRTHMLTHFPDA